MLRLYLLIALEVCSRQLVRLGDKMSLEFVSLCLNCSLGTSPAQRTV